MGDWAIFGTEVEHLASGRRGLVVCRGRKLGLIKNRGSIWVYFPGERMPRRVPESVLKEVR